MPTRLRLRWTQRMEPRFTLLDSCAKALAPLDEKYFLYFEDLDWGKESPRRRLQDRVRPSLHHYPLWGLQHRKPIARERGFAFFNLSRIQEQSAVYQDAPSGLSPVDRFDKLRASAQVMAARPLPSGYTWPDRGSQRRDRLSAHPASKGTRTATGGRGRAADACANCQGDRQHGMACGASSVSVDTRPPRGSALCNPLLSCRAA